MRGLLKHPLHPPGYPLSLEVVNHTLEVLITV